MTYTNLEDILNGFFSKTGHYKPVFKKVERFIKR